MKIILATFNKHKLFEISQLIGSAEIELLSLEDIGYDKEIIEDGKSFIENALIKAETIYNKYKIPVAGTRP